MADHAFPHHPLTAGRPGASAAAEREANAWHRLRNAHGFIFDMDGVLYRGDQPLAGVSDVFDALAVRGRRFMLATNNSMSTPAQYVAKLARMGIDVPEDAILTSGIATRDYLLQTLPPSSGIFVIGMPGLREQLFTDTAFYPVQYGEERAQAVVVGLDLTFDYAKLKAANEAIRQGAIFVATNVDATLPTEAGLVPGAGSIVASVSTASGQQPVVIGKPETPLVDQAMRHMNFTPDETVMIGDRLDTDILAGRRAGMLSVLLLTGVSTREDVASSPTPPDLVLTDLPALVDALAAAAPMATDGSLS